MKPKIEPTATSTQNACKMCTPLGACMVFRGIEGSIPLLHGSQGCATYIRRFLISHFREPVDIASSSFSERTAIFGGKDDMRRGLSNVIRLYQPKVIGVLTTCLAETIGEDLNLLLQGYEPPAGFEPPAIVPVNTPSYCGTHADGFQAAVYGVVKMLAAAEAAAPHDGADFQGGGGIASGARGDAPDVNLLPGMVSPADLRYIREIVRDFGLRATILPDFSDSLDGQAESEYLPISRGGTPIAEIRSMGAARASIFFGATVGEKDRASALLAKRFGVEEIAMGLPIGVVASDHFFKALEKISGQPTPLAHAAERGRLLDAYVDGHKYVFGKRAAVFGDEDMVAALAGFLAEIGVVPVVCAGGGKSGRLRAAIQAAAPGMREDIQVFEGADFADVAHMARQAKPDFLIGNSRGYSLARELDVPLIRVGLPIHDRFGGQRLLHVGYRGAQQLFDRIVNAILERTQEASDVGYAYL